MTAREVVDEADVRAVMLPAFDGVALPADVRRHLERGGVALLVGESREEYVARRMSDERRRRETAADLRHLAVAAAEAATGPLLVAVDQEPGGIGRLDHLVGTPAREDVQAMDPEQLEAEAARASGAVADLGVNLLLAPVVDVVTGANPWLEGRTLAADRARAADLAAAFVRGMQASGRVACTVKHWPGHPDVTGDPALDPAAVVHTDEQQLEADIASFTTVVEAGVAAVMTGPAPVLAVDPARAASCSAPVVDLLRRRTGFGGLVVSDDLDSPALLRGGSVPGAAVQSLAAGVDLLLLASGPQLDDVVAAVTRAVQDGDLPAGRVREAAEAVRSLAARLA